MEIPITPITVSFAIETNAANMTCARSLSISTPAILARCQHQWQWGITVLTVLPVAATRLPQLGRASACPRLGVPVVDLPEQGGRTPPVALYAADARAEKTAHRDRPADETQICDCLFMIWSDGS
jgi:hypothetical protein